MKIDVLTVVFSPDGQRILSGSVDSTLRLWDAASGASLRIFSGHEGKVTSVAFSPDGLPNPLRCWQLRLQDYKLRLWDVATGETLRIFSGHTGGVQRGLQPGGQQFSPAPRIARFGCGVTTA